MMDRITLQEMVSALAANRRGQFFAESGTGDWIGYENMDGIPAIFHGSLREVLESLIPFNGEERHIVSGEFATGVERTADMCRRFPLEDRTKSRKRYGITKNPIRKEGA